MDGLIQKTIRYHKAFKEVYILINDLSPELYLRIPKNFIEIVKSNMDEDYDITLEELNTNGYMEETETLMSLIFRDFICSDELNEKLIEYDKNQVEQEIERYNNIFGNEENANSNETENVKQVNEIENESNEEKIEETSLVVVKEENIFVKILNKIKSLFKRKE